MLSAEPGSGFETCGLKPSHRAGSQAGPARALTPLSESAKRPGQFLWGAFWRTTLLSLQSATVLLQESEGAEF